MAPRLIFHADCALTPTALLPHGRTMTTDRLLALETVISARRSADPASSYVASLAGQGRAKMAQKLGEEAVEAVIAAVADDRDSMIGEGADLMFHLACLLADMDLRFTDLLDELERREGVSGHAEKAARPR